MAPKNTLEERVRNLVAAGFLGEAGEILPIEQTRALWTDHDGSMTKFHELIGKFCSSSMILDVCGSSSVGRDGTIEFKLTDFVCIRRPTGGGGYFDRITPPAFVVATARSDSPVHLTSQVSAQNDDILIKIFAWDPSGAPVPGVLFDWHCCVRLLKDIIE